MSRREGRGLYSLRFASTYLYVRTRGFRGLFKLRFASLYDSEHAREGLSRFRYAPTSDRVTWERIESLSLFQRDFNQIFENVSTPRKLSTISLGSILTRRA